MANAIEYLAGTLRCEVAESDTHRVLIVTGWNDDDSTRQSIAQYLVGLRACAIDAALNIRAQLDETPEDREEVIRNVIAIVGETNDELTDDQKQDERNPWIAEGIWHLCLAVAARRPEIHPVGAIVTLDYAHIATKDHGLDVAAIYQSGSLFGLSLVESKAYKNDPNRAISRAVDFFKDVDGGRHSARIRQAVQIMRIALPPEEQQKIAGSFWKRQRTYLPNPHYDDACEMRWANPRPSFRELRPSRANIIVMPHMISSFDDFFDKIADEMRSFARSL